MLGKMLAGTSAKQERSKRSKRPGALSSLGHELRDYYVHGGHVDWVSVLLPTSIGMLSGVLISFTVTDGDKYLIEQNPLLWAGVALACGLGVSVAFMAAIATGLAIVIGVELLLDAQHPRKERRNRIRENTRHLRDSLVGERIPLTNLERVRATLRLWDESAEQRGVGWYEHILMNRWRRQRELVEGLLEISWQEALPEAIAYLTAETMTMRSGKPTNADLKDTTEVAWHLACNPTDAAVQRLLSEYLPVERKNGNGYLDFRTGVVYTPRWVYDLVRLVENAASASVRAAGPWSFGMNRRMGRQDTIGNECAPIGDVDRETVEKLYEPQGDGPLGSLREAVETARRV
jgi:hypothetical protein